MFRCGRAEEKKAAELEMEKAMARRGGKGAAARRKSPVFSKGETPSAISLMPGDAEVGRTRSTEVVQSQRRLSASYDTTQALLEI